MKYQIKYKNNHAYLPTKFESRMDAEMYMMKQGHSIESAYIAMKRGDLWVEEVGEHKTLIVKETVVKTYRMVPADLAEEDWEAWVCQQDNADDECVEDRSIWEYEKD